MTTASDYEASEDICNDAINQAKRETIAASPAQTNASVSAKSNLNCYFAV